MDALSSVKTLLGNPTGQDDLLAQIVDVTTTRLKNLLGVDQVPDEMAYIITEVSIIRFNRVGSEGVKSHTVGGESMVFDSDDFGAFESDISAWRQNHQTGGMVFFL